MLNKPPVLAACCVLFVGLWALWSGQGRVARSWGRGIWPFFGVPSQPLGAEMSELWVPAVPPCHSWLSTPSPCLSFPAGGCIRSILADHCHILVVTWDMPGTGAAAPELAGHNTPRTRHHPLPTAPLPKEPRQPRWHQDVYRPSRTQRPRAGKGRGRRMALGVQPVWGRAGGGSAWARGPAVGQDGGALPWAGSGCGGSHVVLHGVTHGAAALHRSVHFGVGVLLGWGS